MLPTVAVQLVPATMTGPLSSAQSLDWIWCEIESRFLKVTEWPIATFTTGFATPLPPRTIVALPPPLLPPLQAAERTATLARDASAREKVRNVIGEPPRAPG